MERNIELKRKSLHLLLGVILVILLMYGTITKTHIFFLTITMLILSVLSKRYKILGVNWVLQNFDRDRDIKKFPAKGFIFYLIGVLLVLQFFPLDIALPSILVLAFADSIGHLFGIKFGKKRHPFVSTKFIEGWIAGFIAGFIAASILIPWYEALAASFFAMLVDGIEVKIGADEIGDNIIMPLVAATAIWSVRFLF